MAINLAARRFVAGPARADMRGMKIQRIIHPAVPQITVSDPGNGAGALPGMGICIGLRNAASADKGKLRALGDDGAIIIGELRAVRPVDHDLRHGKLTGEFFATRLEIERCGHTLPGLVALGCRLRHEPALGQTLGRRGTRKRGSGQVGLRQTLQRARIILRCPLERLNRLELP